jgi:glycosyltransferase involved in cell wall biosynthesis
VLKKEEPDIVHVHTPIASVLGRIAAKFAGVKNIIYTAHGFYFHEGMSKKKYKLFYHIEKFVGNHFTDYLFTQSEEDYLLAKNNSFLKKESNYLHISNGIDINNRFNFDNFNQLTRRNIRKKYDISDEDLLVIFVGRLVKEKGIIDLLYAFKNIKEENINLLVIGDAPNTERDNSINNIIESSDNPNVTFTGRVDNVEDFLYASDVFVLPSYREGMPRSIIEAMAMKNAIIATDIRGSREEVDDDVNGYLVNVKSPNEITSKLIKLSKDRAILEKFKNASYDKAKALYDEEKVVKKQIAVYDRIINQK